MVMRVTDVDAVVFFFVSASESDDEDEEDDDDDELAMRAFLVVFLDGGWLGLFFPSWSLSEKRSVVLRHMAMGSGK